MAIHTFLPDEKSSREIYSILSGCIAPRPIALVATCGKSGINLSPFSFFNVFSIDPPVVAFSPLRRMRDGSLKDTCKNLKETGECTIQIVTHKMVEQVNLSSAEFDEEVDEFKKSGLTPLQSSLVRPPRVAESPLQMECKLLQMIELGQKGGAGNLALCEIINMHLDESIFKDGGIDANSVDLVGRCGGADYVRAVNEALFELPKKISPECIGFDALPEWVKKIELFSANQLAQLASFPEIPDSKAIDHWLQELSSQKINSKKAKKKVIEDLEKEGRYKDMFLFLKDQLNKNEKGYRIQLFKTVACALDHGDVAFAWLALAHIDKTGD